MPPEIRLESLPFDEAIEFFRHKGYALSPNYWRDVWAAEHVRAFTVARVAAMDLLEDIRAQIDKALAKGTPFGDFQRDFEELLQRRGWAGTDEFPPWRIATIFRTNIQSAYQAGRYKQMLEVAAQRPYWMYDAVNDIRTRPSHAALDGKIYRFDHPFWDTWYPPNGFNCFPGGTLVLTPTGWRPIRSIKPHDRVIGGAYQEERVCSVHTNPFHGDLIRLTFEDGRIDATPNHRVLTMRGWVRADSLDAGDVLVETCELSPRDRVVRDIDDPDSHSRQSHVAGPVERKSAKGFTLDREIEAWEEKTEPPRAISSGVVHGLMADGNEMGEHGGLSGRWGSLGVHEAWEVTADPSSLGGGVPCPGLRAPGRGGELELLGCASGALILLLCLAQSRVPAFEAHPRDGLTHQVGGLFSAADGRMDPLCAYSVRALSGGYPRELQQSHQSPNIDPPAFAQVAVGQLLLDVQTVEDFSDAAPLDRFDSMESFRAWARSHARLHTVRAVKRIPYNGIVFNLTVGCGSYIVQGATVHNCRCSVRTLSERDMERRGLKESTQPPDGVEPDPGWDYNPGYEAWGPDLSKYAPPARARLVSAGVDWPRDMDQLQARLNQLRHAVRETGINASTAPLKLRVHDDPRYRGWADWDTGEIALRRPIYDQIREALRRGEASGLEELSAMRTLRHELGHHLGHRYDSSLYEWGGAYRYLMQAINDMWARHTLADFLKSLNLKYDIRSLRQIMESDPNAGYDTLISRLRSILRAAGLDDAEIAALAARLNLSVPTVDFSEEIWAAIRSKTPEIDPDRWGHMGQIIAQDVLTEYLIDALSQA